MNPKQMSMVCSEDKVVTLGADDYKEPQIICLMDQGGSVMSTSENQTGTLRAEEHGHQPVICIQGNCIDRADTAGCNGKGWTEDKSFTLNTIDRPAVYDSSVHHNYKKFDDVSETIRSRYGAGGNNQPLVVASMQGFGDYLESDTASACKRRDYKDATDLVIASVDCRNGSENPEINGTLQVKSNGGWNANSQNTVRQENLVRRLTPLECERLQGYPDGWTDIPGASDSKRYKALGNSIALPAWEFWARRFVEIGNVQSIGSLFDGIGGFPLVFRRAGAETKWTSEIEPFCEDVVRFHTERGEL